MTDKYIRKLWVPQGLADPKTRYFQALVSGTPFLPTTGDHQPQKVQQSSASSSKPPSCRSPPPLPPQAVPRQHLHMVPKLKTLQSEQGTHSQLLQGDDSFNVKTFYSDNGSGNWKANWEQPDEVPFKTVALNQNLIDLDLLSSGKNKQQPGFSFTDDFLKTFNSTVPDRANHALPHARHCSQHSTSSHLSSSQVTPVFR